MFGSIVVVVPLEFPLAYFKIGQTVLSLTASLGVFWAFDSYSIEIPPQGANDGSRNFLYRMLE